VRSTRFLNQFASRKTLFLVSVLALALASALVLSTVKESTIGRAIVAHTISSTCTPYANMNVAAKAIIVPTKPVSKETPDFELSIELVVLSVGKLCGE